jgi:hypothetical protein
MWWLGPNGDLEQNYTGRKINSVVSKPFVKDFVDSVRDAEVN